MARVAAQRIQVAEIPRVGELVEVGDRLAGLRDRRKDEIGPDEARAPGYEQHGADYRIAGIIPCRETTFVPRAERAQLRVRRALRAPRRAAGVRAPDRGARLRSHALGDGVRAHRAVDPVV